MARDSHQPVDASMSFGDHLEELRLRVLLALVAPIPLAIVLFFFSASLVEWLLEPLFQVLAANNLPVRVQALSPPEQLITQLKLSIIFALIAASPWMLWQAWRFIGPGLYRHERRFVYLLIPSSAVLTTAGVLLLYFIMLPLMLQVLVMFGSSIREPSTILPQGEAAITELSEHSRIDVVTISPHQPLPGQMWVKAPENTLQIAVPQGDDASGGVQILSFNLGPASRIALEYRLSEYISFVLLLLVAMAIAFQMPLVILLLGWVGLVTPAMLRRNRRYALAGCAVVAAVITPAEAISMIMMLIPLYALYELGILLLLVAPARAVSQGTLFGRTEDEPRNPYEQEDENDPRYRS